MQCGVHGEGGYMFTALLAKRLLLLWLQNVELPESNVIMMMKRKKRLNATNRLYAGLTATNRHGKVIPTRVLIFLTILQ